MAGGRARGRPRASFRPRITLSILYFLAFFFGILWLMAMPAMLDVARNVPPGPAQREAAREATAAAVRPKLPVALGLALLATGLGIYTGRLPGTRPPDGAR